MVCTVKTVPEMVPTNAYNSAVTGDHAFQAPDFEKGDQRGPCPGLNALANHGYIPHNGIVSVSDL